MLSNHGSSSVQRGREIRWIQVSVPGNATWTLSLCSPCADYGGVNVFHVCLNFSIVYGVKVCGVVCVFVCCLFLTSGCCLLWCSVVGVWVVVIFVCDACSWRCSLMGRVCVSSCR